MDAYPANTHYITPEKLRPPAIVRHISSQKLRSPLELRLAQSASPTGNVNTSTTSEDWLSILRGFDKSTVNSQYTARNFDGIIQKYEPVADKIGNSNLAEPDKMKAATMLHYLSNSYDKKGDVKKAIMYGEIAAPPVAT